MNTEADAWIGGDGSMELTMQAQDDASPWEGSDPPASVTALDPGPESVPDNELPGRAFFSRLGIVRRKPARGDAPTTLSKSCSDKLALKQCTSLLSSLTAAFVSPANAYIHTLVLPQAQYSASACNRAFSQHGRMAPVAHKLWAGGYTFTPFHIELTDLEFDYSRRAPQMRDGSIAASNLAAAWSLLGFDEGITGGVLQGRKAFDPKGASRMSRLQMWRRAHELAERLQELPQLKHLVDTQTYQELKDGQLLANRKTVKRAACDVALAGWIRNEGDSDFTMGPTST